MGRGLRLEGGEDARDSDPHSQRDVQGETGRVTKRPSYTTQVGVGQEAPPTLTFPTFAIFSRKASTRLRSGPEVPRLPLCCRTCWVAKAATVLKWPRSCVWGPGRSCRNRENIS